MHKIALIFGLFFSTSALGQFGYFTFGYGGNATSLSGINVVVNNYNETRPWLDKQMHSFGYLDGITVAAGGGIDHFWGDFEYGARSQKRSASGTDLYGFF